MSFLVIHRLGAMYNNPPLESLTALLAELEDDPEDIEHADVGVVYDSKWSLSVSRGGRVVLEHITDGGERHMDSVPYAKILSLLKKVAEGDIEAVLAEAWVPGYGNYFSASP